MKVVTILFIFLLNFSQAFAMPALNPGNYGNDELMCGMKLKLIGDQLHHEGINNPGSLLQCDNGFDSIWPCDSKTCAGPFKEEYLWIKTYALEVIDSKTVSMHVYEASTRKNLNKYCTLKTPDKCQWFYQKSIIFKHMGTDSEIKPRKFISIANSWGEECNEIWRWARSDSFEKCKDNGYILCDLESSKVVYPTRPFPDAMCAHEALVVAKD